MTNREGLVSVEKEVERGGGTHRQHFWIRPEEIAEAAREMAQRGLTKQQERLADYGQFRMGTVAKDAAGRVRIPGGRPWIAHDPAFPYEQTWHKYWQVGDDGNVLDPDHGHPTAERAETVHKPIIEKAFEKAVPTPAGQQRYAVLTMGAPASGKSSVIKGLVPEEGWVKVDPDNIKWDPVNNIGIPEYKHALDANAEDSAPMAHEESSYIAKKIRARAMEEGYPLLVDGTGANTKNFNKLIDDLHSHGYHVTVVMPDLDKETGVERLMTRAEREGRLVPPEWAASMYDVIPGHFEELSGRADAAHLWDKRGEGGGRRVWSRTEKGEVVHDPERFSEFKARAHSQRLEEAARKFKTAR